MSLLETFKKAALAAFEASNPVNIIYGTVIKSVPLEIEVHAKLKLTKEFLVLTDATRSGFMNGDKVVLLRVQGGHQYVVLDKVVR